MTLTQLILGSVFALAAAIVILVMILPKSKDGSFNNAFLQGLHNYFQFKQLYVEMILKVLFLLSTCFCVFTGFFMLFGRAFLRGLMLMLLGPLVLRLVYEFTMMLILLVQNTMEINRKLSGPEPGRAKPQSQTAPTRGSDDAEAEPSAAPAPEPGVSEAKASAPAVQPPAAEPTAQTVPTEAAIRFCPNCGTRYDANGTDTCPVCGLRL